VAAATSHRIKYAGLSPRQPRPVNDVGPEGVAKLPCWRKGEVPVPASQPRAPRTRPRPGSLVWLMWSGGWALHFAMDYPNPTAGGHRANLDRGRTTPHAGCRNRNHLRSKRSHPTANCPIGRASGLGANRVHSRHLPARRTAQRQAQSKQDWAREAQPAPMPKVRPAANTINPCIALSRIEPTWQCSVMTVDKS
jgi:hypothetical protein